MQNITHKTNPKRSSLDNNLPANPSNPFKRTIRKIEGGLDINFFENGTDNAANILQQHNNIKTTTNSAISQAHAEQMFSYNLDPEPHIATLDGSTYLDGTFFPLGQYSRIGWVGNRRSDAGGYFKNENGDNTTQVIWLQFTATRRLPELSLRGNFTAKRNPETHKIIENEFDYHYPQHFKITIYGDLNDDDNVLWHKEVTDTSNLPEEITFTEYAYHLNTNIESGAKRIKLEIFKWSIGNVLPRITYFAGEMHQGFDGDTLQSIEVLEERTCSINELSYGISSNYCKASFLNRDKMFYEPKYFAMLRRNRSVLPFIKCENKEYRLGRFFSEEWQLDDSSPFMSVKAYDVLFGLQELKINYGMQIISGQLDAFPQDFPTNGITATSGTLANPIVPHTNQSIQTIVERIFNLITDERMRAEIFERLHYNLPENILNGVTIPYVLIAEKSAWEVLQEIANFVCCHIYANRDGEILVQPDEFANEYTNTNVTQNTTISALSAQPKSFKKVRVTQSFRDINDPDEKSIRANGLREFNYDATLYCTTDTRNVPPVIKQMAQNILAKYSQGVAFVDTEWKGDAQLQLKDKFNAQSQFEEKAKTYEILSHEISLSNGFRQVTKGRCIGKEEPLPVNQVAAEINQDNAFKFGLPVKSRTIVNQVNVSYYVLEPCDEPETITVNYRDCEWVYEDGVRTNRFTATVKLEKVYERIERMHHSSRVGAEVRVDKVAYVTTNSIKLECYFTGSNIALFSEFEVRINEPIINLS